MTQALKDLCSLRELEAEEAWEWGNTKDFEGVCRMAGLSIDKSKMIWRSLHRLDLELRHELLGDVIKSVLGSPGTKKETDLPEGRPVGG